MDISILVNITSRAWACPILAQMHAGVAGRQAPLLAATGASRTAFKQSMDHLIEIGLMERNPGHGHPLRPEFRLTPLGKVAAGLAGDIITAAPADSQALLRKTWTLPVLTTLQRPQHFGAIKRDLSTITDRALSQSLRAMEARQWVVRDVDVAARPPRSLYTAVNTGAVISQIAAAEVRV